MQASFEARRSQTWGVLIALALLGGLILGGAGGYMVKNLQSPVSRSAPSAGAVDRLTGYPYGSSEEQRILAILKQEGYEGGGTIVAPAVDRLTGYPSGSLEDQRLRAILEQQSYEGGGTVIRSPAR